MNIALNAINKYNLRYPNSEPVLLTTWPFYGELIGKAGESLSIYYRVDDFSAFPGVNCEFIIKSEQLLMDNVDLVVATSEKLVQSSIRMDVKYLPHGVDYDHFAYATSSKAAFPTAQIPSPRIGFFGLLNSWIDFGLIRDIATERPEWSFILIGPTQVPESSLPKRSNIHYVGPVPYDDLPAHARHFDVALIPFVINQLTIAVNPLKLMEYLSLGLPIVSTPLPEVTRYADQIYIATSREEFVGAIQSALCQTDPAVRCLRQQIAMTHSWKAKAQTFRSWIEGALQAKNEALGRVLKSAIH